MADYESMILQRQDDIYDGLMELDDIVEIRELNFVTGRYEIVKTISGEQARKYMEDNGIW